MSYVDKARRFTRDMKVRLPFLENEQLEELLRELNDGVRHGFQVIFKGEDAREEWLAQHDSLSDKAFKADLRRVDAELADCKSLVMEAIILRYYVLVEIDRRAGGDAAWPEHRQPVH